MPVKQELTHPALSPSKLEVPVAYLQPLIAASRVFAEKQPEANLKDYLAWVYPTEEGVAVSFIRGQIIEKGPPFKVSRRGSTGRSMTVVLAAETFDVVRWSFD